MSDLDRGQQVAALVGRMQATLQQVGRVLDRYKPKEDRDRRELEWAREDISRRLAEVDELIPGEPNPSTDC
jgi:adenine-specific DNA methylase